MVKKIQKLRLYKAFGPDNIHVNVLKCYCSCSCLNMILIGQFILALYLRIGEMATLIHYIRKEQGNSVITIVLLLWHLRLLSYLNAGGFLLLRNFSVTISVSPHVCFILV